MTAGRCLCGNVRFELEPAFLWLSHCHCSMCRKHHGALFGTTLGLKREAIRWTAGAEHIVHYQSSSRFRRPFCGTCGTSLPDTSGATVACPAGLVPELANKPQAHVHIMVGSKASMHEITDGLPQFAEFPPGYGTPVANANPPPQDGKVHGGCLCGAVGFVIDSLPDRMVNCHCSRCRLSRAAMYATNNFVPADSLHWSGDTGQIRSYRVPDAAAFVTSFCAHCGSLLPAKFERLDRYLVPVGSLDTATRGKPRVHIFTESKLAWWDITDALPQFAAMPPRERLGEIFFG